MTPERLIGTGLLITLLLPSLVAIIERRRLHDAFRIALAIAGFAYCWATGGGSGLLLSLCSAIGTMALLALTVAYTQRYWGARLFSGGEIKQLAAGAAWLTPFGAVAYLLVVVCFTLAGALMGEHFEKSVRNTVVTITTSIGLIVLFN